MATTNLSSARIPDVATEHAAYERPASATQQSIVTNLHVQINQLNKRVLTARGPFADGTLEEAALAGAFLSAVQTSYSESKESAQRRIKSAEETYIEIYDVRGWGISTLSKGRVQDLEAFYRQIIPNYKKFVKQLEEETWAAKHYPEGDEEGDSSDMKQACCNIL